ncbi:CRISPR-associated protein Cas4 [Metallosphaera hakonensis]|uniref:CRISPR-associated exonuclease Cas4 n=2 Tax=Metallosphaera hakonensis TaxID=79601 RepID=A0A2U9IRI7_9CREN|nr:CRISPR-associated protein Cas4 [Metallosphaera hakonensis]AWR98642.1 CRISPR-associated protein Cas4 [Metallosphaera hakonensis JCM 8857 = DSM 7519]
MSIKLREDVVVTGTLIWYLKICPREVWYMARQITPYEGHPKLEKGRAIHQIYSDRIQISLEGMKIDGFRREERTVIEIKSSSRHLESARAQTNYYLYRLKEVGLNCEGEIYVPKKGERHRVTLNEDQVRRDLEEVKSIVNSENPPPRVRIKYCKKCAYKDFCWG